ncbi:glycosyltransferase family 2 protein [Rhodosalinus sp.]|uniref:glycosyltransferase family 2 protein n=1 Tax=Rhodosalinus sp. TaxID=2047741 RepID=UPI00397B7E30
MEPDRTPLISVIVPVHNVENHVAACLASLRGQTFQDFEAIVVDDGSTDDSLARARAAAGDDPRFRFVLQENRGLSGARNAGLDVAQGAFVAFLDSDDRVAPEWLERMHAALEESGAPWVATALRYCFPDGGTQDHSAIHGAPDPMPGAQARLHPLSDWREVVRHFPSAWNKLYRRSLIEGLRFDEGTWFEDHAFYWQAARRAEVLLHLPEPLYLQTRGRPGQITASDSDRVFDQFAVLERLRGIMQGADKTGAAEGFSRIATRLLFERSTAALSPERRQRFAAACKDWLAEQGLSYAPDWDSGVGSGWGLVLQGRTPLSVVIPSDGNVAQLAVTLRAFAPLDLVDAELLVVVDEPAMAERVGPHLGGLPQARVLVQAGQGAGSARNAGLDAAKGEIMAFVDAGDVLLPFVLFDRVEALLRAEADFLHSAFRVGLGEGHLHSGFHDTEGISPTTRAGGIVSFSASEAPLLHGHPTGKLFRRAFLQTHGIRFGSGMLPEWQVTLRAALRAKRAVYMACPGAEQSEAAEARRLWRSPAPAGELAAALGALEASLSADEVDRLPPGWRRRLWARAVWERLNFAAWPSSAARWRFAAMAALHARRAGIAREGGATDPFIGTTVRRLVGGTGGGPGPGAVA